MSDSTEIRTLGFEEAWQLFKTEAEIGSEEYELARKGIEIKFDINDYFHGNITIKGKTGKAFVRGKLYKSEDIYTEIEKRERLIKEWLLENFADEEIATPRGM